AAVGIGGTSGPAGESARGAVSGLLDTGAAALGASDSSRTSCRRSPSSVNKRRSVTVKPESCLFSAIGYVLLCIVQCFSGALVRLFRATLLVSALNASFTFAAPIPELVER